MSRDISINISAQDNYTQAITTIRNANQSFSKDLMGLSFKLDALNKTKISLKVDMGKAKQALQEAEKQFSLTRNAADKIQMEVNNANYENARRNFGLVADSARQAEKDILSLYGAISKSENRAGAGGSAGKSLLGELATAGAGKLLEDTVTHIANAYATSAYGSDAGTMFQNALSGVISGAAIGSVVGSPVIGTVAGAAAGLGLGLLNGTTSIKNKKDDAFKNYVQEQYSTIKQSQEDTLARGIGIAGNREQKQLSFGTLLGSDEAAKDFLAEMAGFTVATPFDYDQLAAISKTMIENGYKQDELFEELTKIGDAGTALGMSSEDMNYVAASLGRLRSSEQTTQALLNPLLERRIPVWESLAKAFSVTETVTESEVQEMVSTGKISGVEAAKAIADYMGAEYAGNMDKLNQSYQGLSSNLENARDNMDAAMGEGFAEERKKGLQAQTDYFEGESGEKLKEANHMIGEWRASLENLSEQYERDAVTAVMTGDISSIFSDDIKNRLMGLYEEYTEYASSNSDEAGAKMGGLLAEAQAIAQDEYNASDGAQLMIDSNKKLVGRIRNDAALRAEYHNAGYEMGLVFSKGIESAIAENSKIKASSTNTSSTGRPSIWEPSAQRSSTNTPSTGSPIGGATREDMLNKLFAGDKQAYGLSYVPYDNFPALLHEGERVLTASEARALKGSGASTISITGNSFIIREEADIGKVARELARNLTRASALAI
ncbi:tape measure protein [Desulfitobacterium chlororespirans]|uniref:Tape measure domain-containing protein n=1 Tax=Desulfitobacterium chlororespirans DSM 11544 TaxID=1121395 RepID=A0A1M7TD18_9FIRM|nr:tape measure protein [Desulfitobacterium chlororespirans]SHN68576.1 tape measure domain-containing protein [Desulfitobacterium chlororespirans DSM 11544]